MVVVVVVVDVDVVVFFWVGYKQRLDYVSSRSLGTRLEA